MHHRFYEKTKSEQSRIQIKVVLIAVASNVPVALLAYLTGWYLLILFSIPLSMSIIASFIDTPSLVNSGKLTYYSTMFLAEKEKNGVITIHGGTLFDYVFTLEKNSSGKERQEYIIHQYLKGLLKLMDEYEQNDKTGVKIRGTSYIINERTAEKIGLSIVKTDLIQYFILIYNYPSLCIAQSLAKKKWSLPMMNQIKTFEASISDLRKQKETIQQLHDRTSA